MFNCHWTELGSFKCMWNVNLTVILYLGLPSGLFPSGYLTKPLYATLLSSIHATCSTHIFLLDLFTQIHVGEEYRSVSSSLCRFLHSPVTSSLLTPNTLLNTLFSNALSLRSSHNMSDQFSHPYNHYNQYYPNKTVQPSDALLFIPTWSYSKYLVLLAVELPGKWRQ